MHSSAERQVWHPDRGFLRIVTARAELQFEWRHGNALWGDFWPEAHIDRARAGGRLAAIEWDGVVLVPAPCCACCGQKPNIWRSDDRGLSMVYGDRDPALRQYRCDKHLTRNPCAVEGCSRTRAAGGYFSNDVALCGEHWRIAVPPGSRERRIYHRIFRAQKKVGEWTPALKARYWRIWAALVRRARGLTAGDIDMDEINKMFGWSE